MTGGDPNDWTLLRAYSDRRDQTAFEELVGRYAPLVASVCQRMLRDPNDVHDAVQATFLLLARKAATLHEGKPLSNWLYVAAVHMAMKARSAAAARHKAQAKEKAMPVQSPSPEKAWPEVRPILDEELGRMPEKYRAPLVLCYLEGKSNENAAEILGCPSGTMSRRLARGRELLRDRLVRRGVGVTGALLAGLLAQQCASAAVPAALVASTAKTASVAALAEASPQVLALMKGGMNAMMWAKMKFAASLAVAVIVAGGGAAAGLASLQQDPAKRPALSGTSIEGLTPESFDALHRMIRPQAGESLFKEIPWFLSVGDARRKAAAEGKPILVWAGSGGPPIGVC